MSPASTDSSQLLRSFARHYPANLQIVNGAGVTVAASEQFLRLFNLDEASVINVENLSISATQLFKKENLKPLLEQAYAGEKVESGLLEIDLESTGRESANLFRLRFFPLHVGDDSLVGIIYDNVSESATLQRQLYAKNAELESFVYTVSHDLKSPLAVIDGCVELLQDSAAKDEFLEKNLQMIARSTVRISRLATSLLSLSRVGRFDSEEPDVLPTGKLAKSVYSEYMESNPELESTIVIGDLPDLVLDSNSVVHLFQNLIGNAIKYRSPERKLHIAIDAKLGKNRVVYSVADNGMGIAKEDHKRIFEVFFRSDSSNASGAIEGTGVGLAIVKKVVDQLGGSVWVESQPGEGSCFYFSVSNSRVRKKRL